MGWFLLVFGLFVFGLVYFAAKPLSPAFSQRHLGIKKAISDAAAAHAKARETHQDLRAKLAGLEGELKALQTSNSQDGEAERAQLVKEAREYAERMQKDSGSMASQELQRAQERLRHEVAAQALEKAQALLARELTSADQQALIDQAIEELESGKALHSVKRAKAGLQLVTGGAA
jgi:F-type H+-transporting ATPase subunit b